MSRDIGGIIRTSGLVGGALVLLLIIALVLGSIGALIIANAGVEHSFEPATDSSYEMENEDEIPSGIEVKATTERALHFSDEDYVEAVSGGVLDDDWSVCAVAQVDDGVENATMDLLGYQSETILLQYQAGEWAAYYHDNETGDSAYATINATSPTDPTAVCGVWETDELVIYEDGTASDPATLTATQDPRQVAVSWHGAIDEIRTFDGAIDEAAIATYAEDPIDPLRDETHGARMMFDEGEGSSTHVYYADTDATISGTEWTSGVDDPGLTEGEDYALNVSPLSLTAVEGGYLEGAPVVHVSWPGNPIANWAVGLFDTMRGVLGLLAVGLIVMAASAIMREFGGFGFGGGGR